MTGFDETVPPELDPSTDATAEDTGDNVVAPEGGPEAVDADDEDAPSPMSGDDDIALGHLSS